MMHNNTNRTTRYQEVCLFIMAIIIGVLLYLWKANRSPTGLNNIIIK